MLTLSGVSAASKPGAPTIGTATATGATTATVTFTAPANDGGAAIISYTATSSPGGITGTLSQAGSGTITVSGLTTGTAYTFTVTATNAAGTSAPSAASNSITPVLAIGDAYQGGYYAGQISTSGNSVATHNLVVGPNSSAYNSGRRLKTTSTGTSGTQSVIDGPTNSSNMNNADHPAAEFCEGVSAGGYSDWYLPAQNELDVCYFNLKPGSGNSNTTAGINNNAVPARPNKYTSNGIPAQTSATIFRTGGAEAFTTAAYWSSTEFQTTFGKAQRWSDGYQGDTYGYGKTSSLAVRAIRRVAV